MRVKISALSDKAQKYYAEIAYSLEGRKGTATQRDVLEYLLETMADIEKALGDPITFLKETKSMAEGVRERLVDKGLLKPLGNDDKKTV